MGAVREWGLGCDESGRGKCMCKINCRSFAHFVCWPHSPSAPLAPEVAALLPPELSCCGFRLVVHLKSVNVNQGVGGDFRGGVFRWRGRSGRSGRRTCHSVNCFRFRLTLPIRRRMSKWSGYGCSSAGCRHCCRFDGSATMFALSKIMAASWGFEIVAYKSVFYLKFDLWLLCCLLKKF